MTDIEFSELVGAIYDAAIDPPRWPFVVEQLRLQLGFAAGVMGVVKLPGGEPIIQAVANLPNHLVARLGDYDEEIVELWGGSTVMASLPLEEPILNSQVVTREVIETNRFVREWAYPQGLVDQVALALARDRTMVATLSFSVHGSAPVVSEETLQNLRLLAPHLRRAMTISRLIDAATGMASTFEGALGASASAAILVDAAMTIVYANDAAQEMLRYADPLRAVEGKLELIAPLVPGNLEAVVQAMEQQEAKLGRRGIGIPARRRDRSPVVAHVMPLRQRSGRPGADMLAVAAVFIADTGGEVALPIDALSVIYELTPTEARVFEMIVAGRSTREMAARLSVAPSTLKTHMLQLFAKTGRHRRVDLVRLASELTASG
jgi:DNA-binding CsgD family transcriptional regulator